MKSLENYLNENYLFESIWDIEDNVEDDNEGFIINKIKQFIKNNYKNVDLKSLTFILDEEKEKYVVNCKGNLKLNKEAKSLVNDLFEWGTVEGWFDCSQCLITTLQGAPKKVGIDFDCSGCPKLTSLEGSPKEVGRHFNCAGCRITSLEGAPEKVGNGFSCFNCKNLESLKGAPKTVGGGFVCCYCKELESLEGVPKIIKGTFNCSFCDKLTTLKGAPKYVGGDFNYKGCPNLHSLDGIGKVGGKIFSDL